MITTPLDPRQAINEQGIVCLLCGREFRHLTNTHLRGHGLTSAEYKERFGYNRRRPLMADAVRRTHAINAVRSGLAGRIRRRAFLDDPQFHQRGGQRQHRLEEQLNRQERERRPAQPFFVRDRHGRFASVSASKDLALLASG